MWFKSKETPVPSPMIVECVEQYKVGSRVFSDKRLAEDYAKNRGRRESLAREIAAVFRLHDNSAYNPSILVSIITYLETQTTIKENK